MEHFEPFFLHVLVQLVTIIAAARLGAWVFGKLGQPQVVGEILAGLMLGPSLLGRFQRDWLDFIFPEDAALVFRVISEIGLVLLMFLIGAEFDFGHLRHIGRAATGVSVAGIVLPFLLGAVLAWTIHPQIAAGVDRTGFVLFVATALSITAIPILGRIMMEMNIQRTPLGTLTITAAAVDDALGWILLATVSAVVRGGFQWSAVGGMLLWTSGFVLVVVLAVRPVFSAVLRRGWLLNNGQLSLVGLTLVLIAVFVSAAATNLIGIFSIFGPFVLGAALSHEREFAEAVFQRLRQFVEAFFLPVFFTYTGLRTNIGLGFSGALGNVCSGAGGGGCRQDGRLRRGGTAGRNVVARKRLRGRDDEHTGLDGTGGNQRRPAIGRRPGQRFLYVGHHGSGDHGDDGAVVAADVTKQHGAARGNLKWRGKRGLCWWSWR
jgi:Kef-type K+ transport system membrane component KefB